VRAEGLEPSRALRPNGFSYPSTAFAALGCSAKVWGLDYPFTSPGYVSPVFRCCPSSLYTFPTESYLLRQGLARDRHFTGFPEFEQFCTASFPAGTQVSRLSPMRLPIPPRPRGSIHGNGEDRNHERHKSFYSSCSAGCSVFFGFFFLMLIAEASRLFLRWEA
jgi:hypothetical protein